MSSWITWSWGLGYKELHNLPFAQLDSQGILLVSVQVLKPKTQGTSVQEQMDVPAQRTAERGNGAVFLLFRL